MKNRYVWWVLFALALAGAANAIKHVVRWHSWQALMFVLVKDVAMATSMAWFYRLSQLNSSNEQVVRISTKAVSLLLLVSYAADYAIIMLHG